MKANIRRLFVWVSVVGLCLGLAGCPTSVDSAIETVTDTAALRAGGTLTVSNVNGSISITSNNGNLVSIEARKRVDVYRTWGSEQDPDEFLEELEVRVREEDGDVEVETIVPSTIFVSGVVSTVHYTINAPRGAKLILETTNGDITVDDVHAEISIETVNGNVATEDTTGDLSVDVENGNVTVEHEAALGADESIVVDLENGNIDVAIPDESAFDIQAETTVGDIDDDGFGLDIETRNVTGQIVSDTVNGGGAQLDLDVEVGSIDLIAL